MNANAIQNEVSREDDRVARYTKELSDLAEQLAKTAEALAAGCREVKGCCGARKDGKVSQVLLEKLHELNPRACGMILDQMMNQMGLVAELEMSLHGESE